MFWLSIVVDLIFLDFFVFILMNSLSLKWGLFSPKSSFTNQSTTLLIFEVEKGDGYAGLDLITGTDYILDFMIQYSSTVQII